MGDVVLTSPIVRCVKQQIPGAEVHFLVKKRFADLVRPNPYIDRVIEVEKDPLEQVAFLKKEGYGFVADLQGNLRTLRLRRGLGVPSGTFPKLNLRKWLLVNLKWDLMPRGLHVVDRYFEAVKALGVRNDGQGLDAFVAAEDEVEVGGLHEKLRPGGFVAMAVGATYFTKQIPAEKLVELCRASAPVPVVLLGGPEDREKGERIAAEAGPHVSNQCGRLRIGQSISVLRQSARTVAPDTGLMHLAAALCKPLTVYWGSTVPAFGMGPYYPAGSGDLAEHREVALSCRPCSKLGKNACPKGHFRCMTGQD